MTTFKAGDGAVAGVHRVAVSGARRGGPPLKFQNTSSSDVRVAVKRDQAEYAVDLK